MRFISEVCSVRLTALPFSPFPELISSQRELVLHSPNRRYALLLFPFKGVGGREPPLGESAEPLRADGGAAFPKSRSAPAEPCAAPLRAGPTRAGPGERRPFVSRPLLSALHVNANSY